MGAIDTVTRWQEQMRTREEVQRGCRLRTKHGGSPAPEAGRRRGVSKGEGDGQPEGGVRPGERAVEHPDGRRDQFRGDRSDRLAPVGMAEINTGDPRCG